MLARGRLFSSVDLAPYGLRRGESTPIKQGFRGYARVPHKRCRAVDCDPLSTGRPADPRPYRPQRQANRRHLHSSRSALSASRLVSRRELEVIVPPLMSSHACHAVSFRYFYVQRHLVRGVFPPSRIEGEQASSLPLLSARVLTSHLPAVSAMALLVGALICAAFGVIVGTRVGASSG